MFRCNYYTIIIRERINSCLLKLQLLKQSIKIHRCVVNTVVVWLHILGTYWRMGEERGAYRSWWGNRRERDHWGDLVVDGWIILGWISSRWDVGMWTGLGWPRTGTGGGRL